MKTFRFVVAILAVILGFVGVGAGCYYVNAEGVVDGLNYVIASFGYTSPDIHQYLTYTMVSTVLTGVFIIITGVYGIVAHTENVEKFGYDLTNTILAFAAFVLDLICMNGAVINGVFIYFIIMALAFGICYLIMAIKSRN